MKDQIYALGIDIGSTTVKIVILDPDGKVVFPTTGGILPTFRRRSPS